MFETSLIYHVFSKFWNQFKFYYNSSFLNILFTKIFSWCMKVWNGSFIRRLMFNNYGLEGIFEDSFLGKFFYWLSRGISRIGQKLSVILKSSCISNASNAIFDILFYRTCRSYGMVFLTTGLFSIAYSVFDGQSLVFYVTAFAIALVGLILFLINRPLVALYNGSYLLRLKGGFFGFKEIYSVKQPNIKPQNYGLFGLIGLAFSFVFMYYGLLGLGFVFAALIGTFLIFYKTEVGVFATIFLIPLLPTMLILGLVLLTTISFFANTFISGKIKIRFTLLDLFVSLFGVLLLYSVTISYFRRSSLVVALTYILFIMFYFVVKNIINTREKLLTLISLLVVAGGLVSLYGIYQYVTGNYIKTDAWLDTEMFNTASSRIYSTLDNPNVLGEYLLFIIPLSFAMVYYFENYFYKFIGISITGLAGICMIMTYSRGAWLGLILAFGIYAFLKDRRLLWLALIGLILLPLVVPESIVERFTSIGNMSDGSTSYRVNIWLASILMLKAFWPIGIGLGTETFVFIYRKYAFNAINAPHSHNLYLQVIIDLGIVGFILMVGVILTYYKTFFIKIAKIKDSFLTSVGVALCAGMGGYLLQGLTDNVWYNYRIVLFFWVIIALSGCWIDKRNTINKNEVLN